MKQNQSDSDQRDNGPLRDPSHRPQRFPIRARFQYRECGALLWQRSTTVDISRSGVFFRAEHRLPPGTVLEMRIGFAREMTGGTASTLFCCGPVVRNDPNGAAALFLNYRFEHE